MDDDKKCAFCNKETALAVFGVLLGVLFIAMSVDVIRRSRMEQSGRPIGLTQFESEVTSDE